MQRRLAEMGSAYSIELLADLLRDSGDHDEATAVLHFRADTGSLEAARKLAELSPMDSR